MSKVTVGAVRVRVCAAVMVSTGKVVLSTTLTVPALLALSGPVI